MKPNEGRLQTAEHILARTLESRLSDAKFIIAKFEENSGYLEIATKEDLRKVNRELLQDDENAIIERSLLVSKYILTREDAKKEFDLTRLPFSVRKVRIVEIEGFDKTPCKDPHVENTSEIGYFAVLSVERVGKDRYRFVFEVR
jgi:misacylated tRNA(Ala) deacylase